MCGEGGGGGGSNDSGSSNNNNVNHMVILTSQILESIHHLIKRTVEISIQIFPIEIRKEEKRTKEFDESFTYRTKYQ